MSLSPTHIVCFGLTDFNEEKVRSVCTQYERDIERAQARVKYANTNFVKRILDCVLVKEYTSRARDIRNPYTLTKPLSRCSSMLY